MRRLIRNLALAAWCCSLVVAAPVAAQGGFAAALADQQRIAEVMAQGRTALERGRPQEAMAAFESVLKMDPNHVEAHFRIGAIFWGLQQVQKALEFMERSSQLAPSNASLHLSVGGYFEQANLLDQAIAHYRAALPLLEGTPEYKAAEKRTNLALVKQYAARGDMDTSLQLLNALVEEYPDDTRVMQHLGFSYVIANRQEDAAQIYRNVITLEPNNDSAHMNLAGVYERMGDTASAIIHFRKVIELNLDATRVSEAKIRIGLINAAQLQKQGSLDAAVAELKSVLEISPNHPLANSQLALLYRDLKRFEEAEDALLRVVRQFPDNLDARTRLAALYLEQNNYIDAVWELEWVITRGGNLPQAAQARTMLSQLQSTFGAQVNEMRGIAAQKNQFRERVRANPDDVEAQFNLGVILHNQQLYGRARDAFEQVRRIDPSIARTYLYLAEVYMQLAKFGDAADAMLQYVALETDEAAVERSAVLFAQLLGQKLYDERQLDAALFQFRRVLAVNPDDALPLFYTAQILSQQGKLEESAVAFEKVVDKVPGHMGARTNLALVYEQLGREVEALAQYRRVALAAAPGPVKDAAEKRAVVIQRMVNGLSSSAGYGLTFDSNANLNDENPSSEYYSSLTANFTYRYKYSDFTRMGMSYTPTYTTYHVGQYDYLNESFEPFWNSGTPRNNYTARYNYTQVSGVLNEDNVSVTQSLTGEYSRALQRDSSLGVIGTYRRYEAEANNFFDSKAYNVRAEYARSLGGGYTDALSYTYTYNDNIETIDDPEQPQNSNVDAIYRSHALSYHISRFFTADLSGSLTANASYTDYVNPDRFGCERRQNTSLGLSAVLNYRVTETIRVYGSFSYVDNRSNLPVFVYDPGLEDQGQKLCNGQTLTVGGIRPIEGEELIGVPLQSASLGAFRKELLTVGVQVSF